MPGFQAQGNAKTHGKMATNASILVDSYPHAWEKSLNNEQAEVVQGGCGMNLPDFLTEDAYGHIHVTGHRIGLNDVVYFYNDGQSPEMLHEQFPTLSLALIHKVIAFYLENQAEV